MDYRTLLVAARARRGRHCRAAQADTIAVDNGIAVKESDVATPAAA